MNFVVAAVALSITVVAQDVLPPAPGGQIQGRVVDETAAGVSAFVRVIQNDTGAVVARIHTDLSGIFRTGQLDAGYYSLTAWSPGFRRRELAQVNIRSGETTNLGRIQVEISGEDTPGVMADEVSGDVEWGRTPAICE